MPNSTIKLKVTDIKRVKTPYDGTRNDDDAGEYSTTARTYIAAVQLKDVPAELDDWRKVNVRDPLMTSGVAKAIASSLRDNPQAFFFKNRGMTIIADAIEFLGSEDAAVELTFGDPELSGLLDGGHTYTAIRTYVDSLDEEGLSALDGHVKVEIIVGLKSQDDIVAVVEARNTSTQVKVESLEELANHFEQIKNVLRGEPYFENIAFKEVELADDGSRKSIDIKEILSYLMCFDAERYPLDSKEQPVVAYSSKAAVIKYFKNDDNRERLTKYIDLLPEILKLHDKIYMDLPSVYNSQVGGSFGRLTGVSNNRSEVLPFTDSESSYGIPSPFIYPILAAFRSLVSIEDGKAIWTMDPFAVWDSQKVNLAISVVDEAKKLQNPNKMGKQKSLWETCYRDLLVARLTGTI